MKTRRITPEEARHEQAGSLHWRSTPRSHLVHAYERENDIHLKEAALCGLKTPPPFKKFVRSALVDQGQRCVACTKLAQQRIG